MNILKGCRDEVTTMADRRSRITRPPAAFQLDQDGNNYQRIQFTGERQVLELISLGAPLPGILNKLCAAMDFQIGNVVSLILLPNGIGSHHCSVTQSATLVGLHLFSSMDILSGENVPLGTLEIYSCDPRRPTRLENQLIERVLHLAAIAIQRRENEEPLEVPSKRSKAGMDVALEKPRFIN
jgi:hypothetical protein